MSYPTLAASALMSVSGAVRRMTVMVVLLSGSGFTGLAETLWKEKFAGSGAG